MILLVSSLALSAHAADVSEEADHLFRMGIQDVSNGEYESALTWLLASQRLVPNRNVEFNIARVYEELGELDLAWRHYRDYVDQTPDATARADGEAALARLDPQVARVKITSTPPGATVFVGRVDLGPRGVTPMTLALPAGKSAIILDLPGYVRAETTAELTVGKESRSVTNLLPVPTPPKPAGAVAVPFQAVVRAGNEVLVQVDADTCALLPSRVEGAGAIRWSSNASGTLPPGSVLGALGPVPPLALDVTSQGVTARTALAHAEKQTAVLLDSTPLRAWVFERCTPTDPNGGLAHALDALPPVARAEAVPVFGEWAALRGAPDVFKAAAACSAGDCKALAAALTAP